MWIGEFNAEPTETAVYEIYSDSCEIYSLADFGKKPVLKTRVKKLALI